MTKRNSIGSLHRVRKPSAKKTKSDVLASCPIDGAGWCPYPFTMAQLRKRLKAKTVKVGEAEPVAASSRGRARARVR